MIMKSVLVGATAIAIALTSFDLRPVAAAPLGGVATIQPQSDVTDISAQRKRKRGYRGNPAVPLAAFGAIIGTIGAVAAANSRRDYYERPYYGPRAYGYYDAPPAYHYAPPAYHSAPVYQHRVHPGYGHQGRWSGHPAITVDRPRALRRRRR